MAAPNLPINPGILKWAREEAGLTLAEAARRAHVSSPRRKGEGGTVVSPAERLAAWEAGIESPSFAQLKKVADAYYRPLVTFFLPNHPKKQTKLADFRTVGSRPREKDSPEFAAFKRRLEALQEDLIELAHLNGQEPLAFVGCGRDVRDAGRLASLARERLSLSFGEQQKARDAAGLLKLLRDRMEGIGLYVLLEGDLGSSHSAISTLEFRGIALADRLAPLVVVNPHDGKTAQVFTLVHEFAHILRGASGVSNLEAPEPAAAACAGECLCNAAAAEFLVPAQAFREKISAFTSPGDMEAVDEISKAFKVSHAVIARRLLDAERINRERYAALLQIYRTAPAKEGPKPQNGHPTRNRVDRFRLGDRLLSTVTGAAFEGKITLQSAARILRIPVGRFEKVLNA